MCHPFWEHEFLIPDFNKFSDLTPADPVGDLRQVALVIEPAKASEIAPIVVGPVGSRPVRSRSRA